jgi:hypothetical protein
MVGTKVPMLRFLGNPNRTYRAGRSAEYKPMLGTILLVVLILLLIGALPNWGHSRNWGYGPSGGLGLVVLIIIILLLMGRI